MTQSFDDLVKLLDSNEVFIDDKNSDMFKLSILLKDVFKAGAQSKQAEIDELRKRLNMYEREGCKLVPVETTKDMLNSGYRVKHDKIIDLGSVYKAMIGACDD